MWILSEPTLNFGAEGGNGEILYRVDNPVEGINVVVHTDANWISNIVVDSSITFSVSANDTAEARLAKLVVSYDTKSYILDINQAAGTVTPEPEPEPDPTPTPEPLPEGYDVALRATVLSGEYCDKVGSAYNYYIILSDVKCSHSRDIMQPNSYFYCFDIYAKSKSNSLPNGTYTIDLNDTHKAGTVAANVSPCVKTDGNGDFVGGMLGYEAGTLTVSNGKIVAELEMSNGEKHYLVYEGSLTLSYK